MARRQDWRAKAHLVGINDRIREGVQHLLDADDPENALILANSLVLLTGATLAADLAEAHSLDPQVLAGGHVSVGKANQTWNRRTMPKTGPHSHFLGKSIFKKHVLAGMHPFEGFLANGAINLTAGGHYRLSLVALEQAITKVTARPSLDYPETCG